MRRKMVFLYRAGISSRSVLLAAIVLSLSVLIVLGAMLSRPAVAQQSATGQLGGCGWGEVPSPNTEVYNGLNSLSALSDDDIWAVGGSGPGAPGQLTLIEHWNGQHWSVVPSPNPGSGMNTSRGVAALSPTDVWAVGTYGENLVSLSRSLVLHWDGTAWLQVPSPNPGTIINDLYGITAVAANDMWAVGYMWVSGSRHQTLILHWDGSNWSQVASPNQGTFDNHLTSIAAISANDIWAVGQFIDVTGVWHTLTEHWDGAQWSIVPSPNTEALHAYLSAVAAVSANDVWAVGYFCPGNCLGNNAQQVLTMHWNGLAWSIAGNPWMQGQNNTLYAAAALSGNDVWAMGGSNTDATGATLAMHWDGTEWTVVPSDSPSQTCCPQFNGIQVVGGSIWAVGAYHFPGNPVFRTLTERYLGPCGTGTPTSVPSETTDTPTAQPTPIPTDTPTPLPAFTVTPTPCSASFSDVQSSDYFYQAVIYLACHGAISGYGDGTFRPYNNTTRGQLTKIVVLAEGWQLQTPPTPTFRDVPADNAFFPYVEAAYAQGVINGYTCGAGCLEFRPGGNVTRAQLTKIIVLAQGWAVTPPQQPTFRDVAPADPFYGYVETAYAHEIISGYGCGLGCLEFRPGNNATRGQICKIVYSAITQ